MSIGGVSSSMNQSVMMATAEPPPGGTALAATALAASTLPSATAALSALNSANAALSGSLLNLSV